MLRVSRSGLAVGLTLSIALTGSLARAAEPNPRQEPSAFKLDARVGLAGFMTAADGHLQRMADTLGTLALSEQARSGKWANIQGPLGEVAKMNVSALNWFALPDGSYWSLQNGKETANLSERPYWSKVMKGRAVVGDLVVSKATGKSTAIVAVPVTGRDGKIVGVLGASIYLDRLSAQLRAELSLPPDFIFYSFDAQPLLALEWDPGLIFTNPKELGPEIEKVFTEMLSKTEGVVRYTFREKARTVVFRKSALTGWWYAFGQVQPSAAASAEQKPPAEPAGMK